MYNQSLINLKSILNKTINTVSFIKKSLPIYDEIKPLISKFQNLTNTLRNLNIKKKSLFNKKDSISPSNKYEHKKKDYSSNPQFFL